MSPAPMPGPAYWASGGEVRGRSGPLTRARGIEVVQFLERQAEDSRGTRDLVAADALRRMAEDLRRAIASADDWRRAAGGLHPFSLRV